MLTVKHVIYVKSPPSQNQLEITLVISQMRKSHGSAQAKAYMLILKEVLLEINWLTKAHKKTIAYNITNTGTAVEQHAPYG